MFVLVVSLLYMKQRFSVFRLNRNKQKTNRNSLIESIYWHFFIKICVVSGCFGYFETICFGCFEFYTEIACFDVSIGQKQTEYQLKQFDREHLLAFLVFFRKFRVVSDCFGWIRNSSVCFGCVDIGSKHQNKPKILVFGFTKQPKHKTDLVSVCFGSNRNFLFRF